MGYLTSDEILELLCFLNELVSDKDFYTEASSRLKALDRSGFEEKLQSRLLEGTGTSTIVKGIREKIHYLASSIQYNSPVFGRWLRIRFVHAKRYWEDSALRKIGHEYFEEAHNAAPKHANLLFSADLEKPAQVQFGGEEVPNIKYFNRNLGKGDHDPGILLFSNELWQLLQEIVAEKMNVCKFVLEQEFYDLSDLPKNLHDFIEIDFKKYLAAILRQPLRRSMETLGIFRLFVFTFFYSIIQKADKWPCIYHLVIPINFGEEHVGSYCGAFKTILDKQDVRQLTRLHQAFVKSLLTLELLNIEEIGTARLTVTEDMIRLCTRVTAPNQELPPEMMQCRQKIEKLIEKRHNKGVDALKDPGLIKIRDTLLSANSKFLTLLDDLSSILDWFGLEARSVFLYSERGLGKELLAQLCHYLSKRSVVNPEVKKYIQGTMDSVDHRAYAKYFDWLIEKKLIVDDKRGRKLPAWQRFRTDRKEFNFRIRNASTLSGRDYIDILWGHTEPGLMWEAHVLGGTLFLDEINTIKPEVADGILRCLEDPFEIVPRDKPPLSLNLLHVFASNESPEGLRSDLREPSLNLAFVDRITRQFFYVPPLRDRKEDIALIFNAEVRKKNEQLPGKQVLAIDIDAIRLLVELKWKKNVRDIKDLVDEIFTRKMARELTGEVAQRITFEEVIYAVTKRGLI